MDDHNIDDDMRQEIENLIAKYGYKNIVVRIEPKYKNLCKAIEAKDIQYALDLINDGVDVNQRSGDGILDNTPLVGTIDHLYHNIELIKKLIAKGANVNGTTINTSALWLAISKKKIDVIKILLEYGANPNLKVGIPLTSLFEYACKSGSLEIVKMMFLADASYHTADEQNIDLALISAISSCNLEIFQFVYDNGCIPLTKDENMFCDNIYETIYDVCEGADRYDTYSDLKPKIKDLVQMIIYLKEKNKEKK